VQRCELDEITQSRLDLVVDPCRLEQAAAVDDPMRNRVDTFGDNGERVDRGAFVVVADEMQLQAG
jgi:hypothetical protein